MSDDVESFHLDDEEIDDIVQGSFMVLDEINEEQDIDTPYEDLGDDNKDSEVDEELGANEINQVPSLPCEQGVVTDEKLYCQEDEPLLNSANDVPRIDADLNEEVHVENVPEEIKELDETNDVTVMEEPGKAVIDLTIEATEKTESLQNLGEIDAGGFVGQEQQEYTEQEGEIDIHPYLHVIEGFEYPKEQVSLTTVGATKPPSATPLHIIDSRAHLIKLLQSLRIAKEISIDLYFDTKCYERDIYLMSLSTKEVDYIIDAVKLKNELLLLTEIFTNPKIVKIVNRAEIVLAHLQQRFCLYIVNIFDIDKAGLCLLGPERPSVQTIIKQDYSFVRNYKLQHADFRTRPLTEEMKLYCRSVTHYMIYIYHDYKNKLIIKDQDSYKNLLRECREASKVLHVDYQQEILSGLEEDMKRRHLCEIEFLRKLFAWRNGLAAKFNRNPDSIIGKKVLLILSSRLVADEASILNVTKSPFVKNDIDTIIKLSNEVRAGHHIPQKRIRMKKNKAEPNNGSIPTEKPKEQNAGKRKLNNKSQVTQNKRKRLESQFQQPKIVQNPSQASKKVSPWKRVEDYPHQNTLNKNQGSGQSPHNFGRDILKKNDPKPPPLDTHRIQNNNRKRSSWFDSTSNSFGNPRVLNENQLSRNVPLQLPFQNDFNFRPQEKVFLSGNGNNKSTSTPVSKNIQSASSRYQSGISDRRHSDLNVIDHKINLLQRRVSHTKTSKNGSNTSTRWH